MNPNKSTNPLPLSIKNDRLAWLLGGIWQRPHSYNTNFSAVLAGKVGSGKSWLSLSLAEKLDCDRNDVCRFDIDRVAFSSAEFAGLVKQNLPVGSAICFDDAGLYLFSRESMVRSVKEVCKIFQCCRYRRQLYFLSLPTLGLLDKGIRMLLTAYIEPTEIDFVNEQTRAKFQWLQTSPKEGKIYFKRPVIKQAFQLANGYNTFKYKTIDSILFDAPSKQLAKDYEAKKKEVMDAYLEKAALRLEAGERPKEKKVNDFAKVFRLVSKNKEAFSIDGRIDAAKIMLGTGCGIHSADRIAKNLNSVLKAGVVARKHTLRKGLAYT